MNNYVNKWNANEKTKAEIQLHWMSKHSRNEMTTLENRMGLSKEYGNPSCFHKAFLERSLVGFGQTIVTVVL